MRWVLPVIVGAVCLLSTSTLRAAVTIVENDSHVKPVSDAIRIHLRGRAAQVTQTSEPPASVADFVVILESQATSYQVTVHLPGRREPPRVFAVDASVDGVRAAALRVAELYWSFEEPRTTALEPSIPAWSIQDSSAKPRLWNDWSVTLSGLSVLEPSVNYTAAFGARLSTEVGYQLDQWRIGPSFGGQMLLPRHERESEVVRIQELVPHLGASLWRSTSVFEWGTTLEARARILRAQGQASDGRFGSTTAFASAFGLRTSAALRLAERLSLRLDGGIELRATRPKFTVSGVSVSKTSPVAPEFSAGLSWQL